MTRALPFLEALSKYDQTPTMETTIEEKHARVSKAQAAMRLGPVRVSLSNRLPLLGRLLKRGHINPELLLRKFEDARHLLGIPAALGLTLHPSLSTSGRTPALLLPLVTKAVYHCDDHSMYTGQLLQAQIDKKAKLASARAAAKAAAGKLRKPVIDYRTVHAGIMSEHLLKVIKPNVYYSVDPSLFKLETMDTVLKTPDAKRIRAEFELEQDTVEPVVNPVVVEEEAANT